jgi:hypothetical protein
LLALEARTAPTHGRLGVTHRATISVKRRAEAGTGFIGEIARNRIDFLEAILGLGKQEGFTEV